MTPVRMQFVSRPSRKEALGGHRIFQPLVKVVSGSAIVLAILFVHVWLPIQSERNLMKLRKMEGQLSIKKAELNNLNEMYSKMTSLTALDHWAKKHGAWVNAQMNNVLPIEE